MSKVEFVALFVGTAVKCKADRVPVTGEWMVFDGNRFQVESVMWNQGSDGYEALLSMQNHGPAPSGPRAERFRPRPYR